MDRFVLFSYNIAIDMMVTDVMIMKSMMTDHNAGIRSSVNLPKGLRVVVLVPPPTDHFLPPLFVSEKRTSTREMSISDNVHHPIRDDDVLPTHVIGFGIVMTKQLHRPLRADSPQQVNETQRHRYWLTSTVLDRV